LAGRSEPEMLTIRPTGRKIPTMDNRIDYFIKEIRRKLVLLTAAIAYVPDLKKRRKFVEMLDEIRDTDLSNLEDLCRKQQ